MSQNSFQQLRQVFSRQRRRQQLQKRFGQKRKKLSEQWAKQQRAEFMKLLPIIDQQNYEQHRQVLSDYARSFTYSYQMLPIVLIAFEYILKNPYDKYSWQIVTYLSYYDDMQIPQTEQFVEDIIRYIDQDSLLISQLLLNLSKMAKYNLLCCRLVDVEIINIISKRLLNIQQIYFKQSSQSNSGQFRGKQDLQLQIYNNLFFLSYLFTIQPILQTNEMVDICQILKYENKSNKFLRDIHVQAIFTLISNSVQNLSHQPHVFKLIIDIFQQNIHRSFFTFQAQCIKFIQCCVKNKVLLSSKLIEDVYNTMRSSKSNNIVNGIKLIQKIINSNNQVQKMQVQSNKLQSLQGFIDTKIMLSFQQFNSMYSSPHHQNQQEQQNRIKNQRILYSILFTESYQIKLKSLIQIFQKSTHQIKQQIAILILGIIKSLIKSIQSYENHFMDSNQQYCLPQNVQQYLYNTIQQEDVYLLVNQCLNSTDTKLIITALQMLINITLYIQQNHSLNQKHNQTTISGIFHQMYKFNIFSIIQHLTTHQNDQIKNQSNYLLQIIKLQNN